MQHSVIVNVSSYPTSPLCRSIPQLRAGTANRSLILDASAVATPISSGQALVPPEGALREPGLWS